MTRPGFCYGCGGELPPTRRAWCHQCYVPSVADRRRDALARLGVSGRLDRRTETVFVFVGSVTALVGASALSVGAWAGFPLLALSAVLWRSVIQNGGKR